MTDVPGSISLPVCLDSGSRAGGAPGNRESTPVRRQRNGVAPMNDGTVLDELTADLFDLDARTADGNVLAVDAITDNGCGTQPSCRYPDPQN